jgi:dTDP-4-dehydrorhamnose reductase
MEKHILILGSRGQLGAQLVRALAMSGRVIAPAERLDITDRAALEAAITAYRPQWIVNAAAYTAVDRAEDERDQAFAANGTAVGDIGALAKRHGARVIHFSTDYVFDGQGTRPYREDDATGPQGVYGASKLDGERRLQESGAEHWILRTGWVYGLYGNNFLRTMLKLAREREALKVVADQHGAPTPTTLLADVTRRIVEQPDAVAGGLYHVAPRGETTWHAYAQRAIGLAGEGVMGKNFKLGPAQVEAIASTAYPTKAKRPMYSVLSTAKIEAALGVEMPDWDGELQRFVAQLQAAAGF